MVMPERSFSYENYRWGFNGKETDNETNWQDYGFRIYYPGLGKFLSVDPLLKSYPWYTPYQFSGNTPIQAIDIDGLEPAYVITQKSVGKEFEKPVFKSLPSDFIQSKVPTNANFGTPIKKIEDKRTTSQKFTAAVETLEQFDRSLEGGYDGGNSGSEYGGVNGMYKAGDLLDKIGDKFSYIPTPATKLFGSSLSLEADGLRTIADLNSQELSKSDAIINTSVRGVGLIADKVIGTDIENAKFGEGKKYIYEQVTRKLIDNAKEAGTTKPKTSESKTH